ncbi:hypothetical protein PRIPAC_86852 [Pristionchus pacificus]|uniref:Uncharacterized protein n=1 Tax=Pristionchus pacificus TaxID=54126 RepID=A0A2A6D114_PRIPA|nr:hypothetical protein PRIPAC_86852 [Pristionchus pacificus]|eukprot:PDM84172.1 hypothetical protein PRIPAC_35148 [Pristionchus pacificus]
MSDNLANQDKSVKKSKKMETGKASSAKSTSSQETIKTVERSADIVDGEKRKERERHNSGASIHLQPAHRATWSNSHRYTKYRGSSESRRGANHNYSNRDSYVSSSTFDSGNLCRHTSTQSLNSNPSKKIEEEPVEVASSTTSSDAANDIRRIAVNAPDSEEGNVTYIAAGTAPAARIGTLRQNANAAAFSAYAGPAPAPSWEDRSRGGFPPLPTQFKTPRNVDETPLYYEK